jgi:hypothetical protein
MQNRRRLLLWGAFGAPTGARFREGLAGKFEPGNINETENHFLCKTYRRDKLISKNLLDTRASRQI